MTTSLEPGTPPPRKIITYVKVIIVRGGGVPGSRLDDYYTTTCIYM